MINSITAQNYPNPFNPETLISFNISDESGGVFKKYLIWQGRSLLPEIMKPETTNFYGKQKSVVPEYTSTALKLQKAASPAG